MAKNKWNPTNQCMSYITDKKYKFRRCQNKTKSDFCIHHNKYHDETLNNIKKDTIKELKINIKNINKEVYGIIEEYHIKSYIDNITNTLELNQKYKHNLFYLYSSWDEIEISQRIKLDDDVWVVNLLINHITNQLNHSNMENPYPIFPSNPFTRKLFSVTELLTLKKRIISLNIKINLSLKILLNQSDKLLTIFYNEANIHPNNFSYSMLDTLKKHLRFMLLHEKNSQSSYIGIWAPINYPLTHFEKFYTQFMNIPYQLIIDNNIYDNPYRELLKNEFEQFPFEDYDLFDNQFCGFLS